MSFWSWHSAVCRLQKGPERPNMSYKTLRQNRTESENSTTTNDTTRCLICGEQGFERYTLTLRQPLLGRAAGRIIETGSVCEQCAPELRSNARTEVGQ